MPAGVSVVSLRRRYRHLLHPIDNAVVAHVSREVEFSLMLREGHVRLTLRNGLQPLLAAHFGQVSKVLNGLSRRIERVHLPARVQGFRAQHIIDLAVARGAHPVVSIVGERQNLNRRSGLSISSPHSHSPEAPRFLSLHNS